MRWRTSAAKATRARQLRHQPTAAEALLWQYLRGHRMLGLHIRRQHPIDRFIVDFCCTERRVVIEVDGPVHHQQREYDAERTATLEALGYQVLRFGNAHIQSEIQQVLMTIRQHLLHQPEGEHV